MANQEKDTKKMQKALRKHSEHESVCKHILKKDKYSSKNSESAEVKKDKETCKAISKKSREKK